MRAGVVSQRGRMLEPHGRRRPSGYRIGTRASFLPTQVTVVGAGAAGLYTALCARPRGRARDAGLGDAAGRVLELVGAGRAGGGARRADDSPELHLRDTVIAGRDAVRESAARVLCEEAPGGGRGPRRGSASGSTPTGTGACALGLEGGHSRRRIVHAGGAATGRRLVRQLQRGRGRAPSDRRARGPARGRAARPTDGRCVGVRLDDGRVIASGAVVLATGGAAALWSRTTNPPGRRRRRAAARPRRRRARSPTSSCVQFHPTAVVGANGADGFLVTEAIRGEGARLLDAARRAVRRRARAARRGGAGGAAADDR